MRKISAKYIFTGKEVLKNGIIEIDNIGKIINVTDTKGKLQETASLEYYTGVLVPGFVNAHCHLELSHMKDAIKSNNIKGLPGFIDEIISKRNFPENLFEKINKADREMQLSGIVAVGDISNTDDSFEVKKKSKIYYHTFVETLAIGNHTAEQEFKKALSNFEKLKNFKLSASIVPHASYSVPADLMNLIKNHKPSETQIISIHNQETKSEDECIRNKTGELADVLKKKGFVFDDLNFTEKSAVEEILKYQDKNNNILLIHNTFTKEEHIDFAEDFSGNIYWVFCPLSNLYIEKTLPDIPLFIKKGVKTCIGTDSYASNNELSVLSELKVITNRFPDIKFENLIESACLNGAKALKIEDKFGSIEKGKTPGINLIEHFDFIHKKLSEKSKVRVLT